MVCIILIECFIHTHSCKSNLSVLFYRLRCSFHFMSQFHVKLKSLILLITSWTRDISVVKNYFRFYSMLTPAIRVGANVNAAMTRNWINQTAYRLLLGRTNRLDRFPFLLIFLFKAKSIRYKLFHKVDLRPIAAKDNNWMQRCARISVVSCDIDL